MQGPLDSWLPLKDTQATPDGRWQGQAQFSPSSGWFSGHFEEYPLLPGVAILALVVETVKRQGRRQNRILEFSRFSKVRFKRFVFPGEELVISIAGMPYGDKARLDFSVLCRGEMVAQGDMDICEERLRD